MIVPHWRLLTVVFFIAAPWLWPISLGPYAEAIPWLFSVVATAFLLIFWPSGDNSRLLALAWAIAAVLCVIPSLIQYFGLTRFDFFWPWIRPSAPGYASGNIGQPNQQATLFGIGLVALFFLLRMKGSLWKLCFAGALIAIGMAATASRIGTIHILALFIFILMWSGGDLRRLIIWYGLILFFYLLSALLLPELASYFDVEDARSLWYRIQNAEASCGSRFLLWQNVIELIQAKPWFGWGWGDLRYAQYITIFQGPRWCAVLGNAHNLPLHLALVFGIPFALFLCALCAYFIFLEAPWREGDARRQMAWGVLGLVALHSMVEFPLWYGPFQVATGVSIYLLWSTRQFIVRSTNERHAKTVIRHGVVIVFFLTGVVGFLDYWRVSQPYFLPEDRMDGLNGEYDAQKTLDFAAKTIFFKDQALFAHLIALDVNKENALVVNNLAIYLLHFSPEPRVLEKLLDSAFLLNNEQQAYFHGVRFSIAYPREFAAWKESRFPNGGWNLEKY